LLFATNPRLQVNPIDSSRSITIPYLSSRSATAVSKAAASPRAILSLELAKQIIDYATDLAGCPFKHNWIFYEADYQKVHLVEFEKHLVALRLRTKTSHVWSKLTSAPARQGVNDECTALRPGFFGSPGRPTAR
jgi:hypothetical protein